ncbi:YcnI family protein [Paenibacillus humicus]|uniref:YcnI family copper-binding membrane protein n=1 Tax=Paenibacillus humicus TaxID=412861 RepID=UPI003D2D576E
MKQKIKSFSAMLTKAIALAPALAACLLLFASIASAHVTVKPGTTAPGAWETYTIKVPVEKDIPTVKVSLKIPEGLDFKQYRAIPDWKVELTKDSSDKVTVVTWTSEGEGIKPGEFQQFDFVAKNPDSDAELAWDAYQYYSDGSIVEWTGDEGSEKPHSITTVSSSPDAGSAADSASHSHSHDHDQDQSTSSDAGQAENAAENTAAHSSTDAAETSAAPVSEAAESASSASTWTIVLASAALLISLIALGLAMSGRKKSA